MSTPRWYTVPTGPAVYRCFDEGGQLLYIGVSSNPLARIGNHITGTSWWADVERVEFEPHPTFKAARVAEQAAIHAEVTVHNRRGTGRDRSFRRGMASA